MIRYIVSTLILCALMGCQTLITTRPTKPEPSKSCPTERLKISESEHAARKIRYDHALAREAALIRCLDYLLGNALINYRAAGGK